MTKADRAKVIEYIANSKAYDATTVIIKKWGAVTAKKDPNKTLDYDGTRYLVGYVDEILKDYAPQI